MPPHTPPDATRSEYGTAAVLVTQFACPSPRAAGSVAVPSQISACVIDCSRPSPSPVKPRPCAAGMRSRGFLFWWEWRAKVPSWLPVTKRESLTHVHDSTTPRASEKVLCVARSMRNRRTVRSSPHVTASSFQHADTPVTFPVWPNSVSRSTLVSASQIFSVLSCPPLYRVVLFSLKHRPVTGPLCPTSSCTSVPSAALKILIIPSVPPVATMCGVFASAMCDDVRFAAAYTPLWCRSTLVSAMQSTFPLCRPIAVHADRVGRWQRHTCPFLSPYHTHSPSSVTSAHVGVPRAAGRDTASPNLLRRATLRCSRPPAFRASVRNRRATSASSPSSIPLSPSPSPDASTAAAAAAAA
eukprot:Rhum_TRINITY_DN14851_c25_g1::Rhum_TRINITY_DN14851_c25_g1_i1::g.123109::m.123109